MPLEDILVLAVIAAGLFVLWWTRPARRPRDSYKDKEPPLL